VWIRCHSVPIRAANIDHRSHRDLISSLVSHAVESPHAVYTSEEVDQEEGFLSG